MKKIIVTVSAYLFLFSFINLLFSPTAVAATVVPIKVAMIGDSITYGYKIKDREQQSYPSLLNKLLGNNWLIKNYGHNGRTALNNNPYSYWQSPEFIKSQNFKADIAVIMLGTNDAYITFKNKEKHFATDYQALIDIYQQQTTIKKILLCLPPPIFSVAEDKTLMNTLLPIIRQLANKNNLPVIDFHTIFQDKASEFPDKVHPNSTANTIMAKLMANQLKAFEKAIRKQLPENPLVIFKTHFGNFTAELYLHQAPITVTNFLRYVDEGYYKDIAFYRTVREGNQPINPVKIAVLQGGYSKIIKDKIHHPDLPFANIPHETTIQTGTSHLNGTLSMARWEPGTANGHFSIMVGDQPELNFNGKRNPDGQGFTAFGRVISGMQVVREIHQQPAKKQSLTPPIPIISINRVKP